MARVAQPKGVFAALIQQGLPGKKYCLILPLFQAWGSIPIIALFSLYLTPQSVGNAEMTLGGVDESKFIGAMDIIKF